MTKTNKLLFLILLGIIAINIPNVQADWIVKTITSDYDDGIISEAGGKFFDGYYYVALKQTSVNHNAFFNFKFVGIPANATINGAWLLFTAPPGNVTASGTPALDTVYGLKVPDQPSWDPTPDLLSQPLTTAFTNFDTDSLVNGTQLNVTVTNIVRELYNQYNWNGSNEMAFRVLSVADPINRYCLARESTNADMAKLYIQYTTTNGTETYRGYTITPLPGGSGNARQPLAYYDGGASEWRLTSWNDNGAMTHNYTLLGGDTQWDEPEAINWLSIGGQYWAINDTGFFKWTDDYGLTWNDSLPRADIANLNGGQAFAYDETNGVIHAVYMRSSDLYYFNFTISTLTFSTPIKAFEAGTYSDTRWLSIDVNDENGNNDLIVGACMQKGSGTEYTSAFMQRLSGVWTGDRQTWDFATPFHVAVRFRNDGNTTLVIDGDDDSGHTDGGAFMYNYDLSDGLTSIPNYFSAKWNRKPASYVGDMGGYPWSMIYPNGDVYTLYRTDANSTFAGYYTPMVLRSWLPYGTSDFQPSPQFSTDMFNLTTQDYRFQTALLGLWAGDYTDSSTYTLDYKSTCDIAGPAYGIYYWKYGLGGGVAVDTINHEQSASSIQGALAEALDVGDQAQRMSIADIVYTDPLPGGSFLVTDSNGTVVNSTCLSLATTIEEVKACLDALEGGADPQNPDPPGTNYPPDGPGALTRFNIRFYVWLIGWICIMGPIFRISMGNLEIQYYFGFAIMILTGIALLWSTASI